jgi:hypothetical protein
MSQRDWRRDEERDELMDGPDSRDTLDLREDRSQHADEVRQLLLEETVTRAKAAELSQFRQFEEDGASDAEWRLLLMECSPTVH